MRKAITQRQLRNQSGEVMRALDAGVSFLLTRNGVPVGELTPCESRSFVPKDVALAAMRHAAPLEYAKLRADLDAVVDQDATPRA